MATLSAVSQKGLNSEISHSGTAVVQNSDSDLVLEVIASANTADYLYSSTNATSTNTADIPINWPGDFGGPTSATSLSVRMQYHWQTGTQTNAWTSLTAQLVDSGGTPLSNEVTLASGITTTTPTNSAVTTITGLDTGASGATWAGAKLRIGIVITKSMGGDSLEKRIVAAEITGDYQLPAVDATHTQTIAAFGQTASSQVWNNTTHAQSVAAFGQTADALALIGLTQTHTVDAFGHSAAAELVPIDLVTQVQGQGAIGTLPIGSVALAGSQVYSEPSIELTHAQTIADFNQTSSAELWVQATHTQTVAAFGQTANAGVDVSASATQTVPAFGHSASGEVWVSATHAQTVDAFAQNAQADHAPADLSAAQTVDAFGQTVSATVEVNASSTHSISAFGQSVSAGVFADATHAQTVADFTQSATAQSWVQATHAQTVSDFGQSAAGAVDVSANQSHVVDAFGQSADASVWIDASANQFLPAFTIDQQAQAWIEATVSQTIADFGTSADVVHIQMLRPSSDVSGDWLPNTGSTLWECIDEEIPDDGDFDYATANQSAQIKFGEGFDPTVSTGHIFRYRVSVVSGKTLYVRLMCGATEIAAWTHTGPESVATHERTLSGAQADAITDYADMRIAVETV